MPKQQSDHAAAAAQIRAELKKHGIRARVKSSTYSMGSSVDIYLSDQLPATVEAIKTFAGQYEYGHFDGMDDSYHYSNKRNDLPQVKFVFVENEWSDDMLANAWDYCRTRYADASDTDNPQTYKDEQLLYAVMQGKRGNWVTQQKPRARIMNANDVATHTH